MMFAQVKKIKGDFVVLATPTATYSPIANFGSLEEDAHKYAAAIRAGKVPTPIVYALKNNYNEDRKVRFVVIRGRETIENQIPTNYEE